MKHTHGYRHRRSRFFRYVAPLAAILLFASSSRAQQAATPQPNAAWDQELQKYPGLPEELSQLVAKLFEKVQTPGPRSESRLLELMPQSAIGYAAFSNYGEAADQSLKIFRQELQESAVLRDWWAHVQTAKDGPKIEEAVEKFVQLNQYLGDEIVVSATLDGQKPRFVVMAAARKPGLRVFLRQALEQVSGKDKPGVRVIEMQELPTAKDEKGDDLIVLVRPDFVVAGADVAAVRSFSARLDAGKREFTSGAFGQRVAQEYRGGLTSIAAVDLRQILKQVSPAEKQSAAFQQSGFADMQYAVWDHKVVGGKTVSEMELSFNGPRQGAAAWLGKPRPLGSLDFVSPKTMAGLTLVLSNPAQIYDDIQGLSGPANAKAFAAVPAFEQMLKLSLKDDLLNLLRGEITLELDEMAPKPAWKAMLAVKDADHLQHTLSTLMAAGNFQVDPVEEGGITRYTVRIPSGKDVNEVAYAFADGYLVIGSSLKSVNEAIGMHRSGGSLGKSEKFLAALPPGRPLEASAMFYRSNNLLATRMGQAMPGLAGFVSQFPGNDKPGLLCFYGEDAAIREQSGDQGLDMAGILLGAAIAIPNLMHSRVAANEASAVGGVRTINTAEYAYMSAYPKRGFAPNLATLGPDPSGPGKPESEQHADLIDDTLGNSACTGDAWCVKNGYRFRVTAACKLQMCKAYVVVATPVAEGTGTRSFCSTEDGIIHYKAGAPVTTPLSAEECRAWAPLQ